MMEDIERIKRALMMEFIPFKNGELQKMKFEVGLPVARVGMRTYFKKDSGELRCYVWDPNTGEAFIRKAEPDELRI